MANFPTSYITTGSRVAKLWATIGKYPFFQFPEMFFSLLFKPSLTVSSKAIMPLQTFTSTTFKLLATLSSKFFQIMSNI